MNEAEVWKPVVGYEGYYEVSNLGRVRGVDRSTRAGLVRGMLRKLNFDSHGYLSLILHREGSAKNARVHRLVAEAFVDNPDAKPEVNHIDRNRANAAASNLEWVTQAENAAHATKTRKRVVVRQPRGAENPRSRAIKAISADGNELTFASIGEAERAGFNRGCAWAACNGKIATHAGYRWQYVQTP